VREDWRGFFWAPWGSAGARGPRLRPPQGRHKTMLCLRAGTRPTSPFWRGSLSPLASDGVLSHTFATQAPTASTDELKPSIPAFAGVKNVGNQNLSPRHSCILTVSISDHILPSMAIDIDREIRGRIDSFAGELSSLIKKAALDAVGEALGGDTLSIARRGPGRPRKDQSGPAARAGGPLPRKARTRDRRSGKQIDVLQDRFVDYVRNNPGKGMEQIAAAIKSTTNQLRFPVMKLLEARKIKTTGQRRGTKYQAV
jgi:hypothetical protein